MPRGRAHYAVLCRVRDRLRAEYADAYALVVGWPGDLYAGLAAPDALRLFAGRDKRSTHFYDDQRRDTWDNAVRELFRAHAEEADPRRLDPATTAWMLGYVSHLVTDVAYWRHVIALLPGPPPWEPHHGAWLLVDRLPIPSEDRLSCLGEACWEAAPAWIDREAVRSLALFLAGRVLPPDDPWEVEIAYHRGGQPGHPSVEELRTAHLPQWQQNLIAAQAILPERQIDAFVEEAVQRSVVAIRAYLAGEFASSEE